LMISGRIHFTDSFNVVIDFEISIPNLILRGVEGCSSSLVQAFLFEATLTREKVGLRTWGNESNYKLNQKYFIRTVRTSSKPYIYIT
jgi:hypothetical protein